MKVLAMTNLCFYLTLSLMASVLSLLSFSFINELKYDVFLGLKLIVLFL